MRETLRALQGGAVLREVFVEPGLLVEPEAKALLERLREESVPLIEVGREAFERLAYGDRLDGVIAVAETSLRTLADLVLPPEPLIAVIEGVEKPGNLGAVLRTADGAGVNAVIVAESATDLFNPNIIRAIAGRRLRRAGVRRLLGRGARPGSSSAASPSSRRASTAQWTTRPRTIAARSLSLLVPRRAACQTRGASSRARRFMCPCWAWPTR